MHVQIQLSFMQFYTEEVVLIIMACIVFDVIQAPQNTLPLRVHVALKIWWRLNYIEYDISCMKKLAAQHIFQYQRVGLPNCRGQ
jgi:hypothetical protein